MSAKNPVTASNLGNVLLEMGLVSMDRLKDAVLAQMEGQGERQLGAILLTMGAVTEADLQVALDVQKAIRQGKEVDARMTMMRYQTARLERSVDRQTLTVDKALETWDRLHHA